jgi:hypothetical protein
MRQMRYRQFALGALPPAPWHLPLWANGMSLGVRDRRNAALPEPGPFRGRPTHVAPAPPSWPTNHGIAMECRPSCLIYLVDQAIIVDVAWRESNAGGATDRQLHESICDWGDRATPGSERGWTKVTEPPERETE